jgi:hypothetical protein
MKEEEVGTEGMMTALSSQDIHLLHIDMREDIRGAVTDL